MKTPWSAWPWALAFERQHLVSLCLEHLAIEWQHLVQEGFQKFALKDTT